MPERPRPDLDAVSEALREHDARNAEESDDDETDERPGDGEAEDGET